MLTEPRFLGSGSFYVVPHPRPGARRIFAAKTAQGIQIISWRGFAARQLGSLAPRVGLASEAALHGCSATGEVSRPSRVSSPHSPVASFRRGSSLFPAACL